LPPGFLKRDQPVGQAVFTWNGQIVVQADRFYTLDIVAAKAAPLRIANYPVILGLAMMGKRPASLCRNLHRTILRIGEGQDVQEIAVPKELGRVKKHRLKVGADASSFVAIDDHRIYCYRQKQWKVWKMPFHARSLYQGRPDHLLVHGAMVYIGYDQG